MKNNFRRKSNRLPSYLYEKQNAFFITIVVQDRLPIFGSIHDGKMMLNIFGNIVVDNWKKIDERFAYVEISDFVVMPNHLHGIIYFHDIPIQKNTSKKTSLGNIISRFKNFTRKNILDYLESNPTKMLDSRNPYKFWQKSYHDHIIRNENDLEKIQEYITNNPLKREIDTLNTHHT